MKISPIFEIGLIEADGDGLTCLDSLLYGECGTRRILEGSEIDQ